MHLRVVHGRSYTLSEAWSGVNWADLMAAQGAFGTNFYDRSTRTIVGTMLWTEYRPVIKTGSKGALGSHEIRSIHFAPSPGQSIGIKNAIRIGPIGVSGSKFLQLSMRFTAIGRPEQRNCFHYHIIFYSIQVP